MSAIPLVPECGRVGCTQAGTVTTTVLGCRGAYELYHCPDHQGDGPKIATALGFQILDTKVTAVRA